MKKGAHDQKTEQPALSRDLDPWLVLKRLFPEERDMIGSWLTELGFEPEDWSSIPPVRSLVELLAVGRVAVEIETKNAADAFRRAAEQLGIEDDERATHPADRYAAKLSRWRKAISRAGRQNVCPPDTGSG